MEKRLSACRKNAVPRAVPGVVVDASPRRVAEAASGERPTAPGDREQDMPDWLQPLTERTGGRRSLDHPAVLVKRFPKTLPPHVPAKLKQAQGSAVLLNNPRRYFVGYALNAGVG